MPTAKLGLNFSHRQASALGLDPEEAFYAVLFHLRPQFLRLSLYWDECSPEPGRYDFRTVRWQLDRAHEFGCRVLMTIGFKTQRHPSFYPPRWLISASETAGWRTPDEGRLAAHLLMMLERAVALLADYDVVDSWEVENQPFLPLSLQPAGWSTPTTLVLREIAVTREVDPRHRPVVISYPATRAADRGWRMSLRAGDTIGLACNLPTLSTPALCRLAGRLQWELLALEVRLQAALVARAGRGCWITELGTEPPDLGRDLPGLAERTINNALRLARRSRVERAYLIGSEPWLLMRESAREEWWTAARAAFRSQSEADG